jgi:DNA-binding transcriptional ArsR family regulator
MSHKETISQQHTALIKVISNSHRMNIIAVLGRAKHDMCVNQIADAVGISQSLASHQLAYLTARNIVTGYRMGQTTCYILADNVDVKKIKKIVTVLTQ